MNERKKPITLKFFLRTVSLLVLLTKSNGEGFDSNGRLTQVEYADRASMKGGTIIGMCSDCAATLLTWSPVPTNSFPLRKIHRITSNFGVSSSGVVSDVHYLTNKLFEESLDQLQNFGSETPAIRAANSLASLMHRRTIDDSSRPLGVRMCFANYDDISKGSILEIDPMGNLHKCKVTCVGPYAEKVMKKLLQRQPEQENLQRNAAELLQESIEILRSCLAEEEEEGITMVANDVSIAYVGKNTPFTILEHGHDILKHAIERQDFTSLQNQLCPSTVSSNELTQ